MSQASVELTVAIATLEEASVDVTETVERGVTGDVSWRWFESSEELAAGVEDDPVDAVIIVPGEGGTVPAGPLDRISAALDGGPLVVVGSGGAMADVPTDPPGTVAVEPDALRAVAEGLGPTDGSTPDIRGAERLERFASVVNHDLRNPLNVAQGRLELARKSPDDAAHFDTIERAHDRMAELMESAVSWARQGQPPAATEPLDIGSVARSVWERTPTGSATLEITASGEVHADEERLSTLLGELFENATIHGGDDITVRVDATDGGFSVADTGSGIDQDLRDRVTEPGYSTDKSAAGFGLAIVVAIAEAHGWSLTVEEGPEGGARFAFSLE